MTVGSILLLTLNGSRIEHILEILFLGNLLFSSCSKMLSGKQGDIKTFDLFQHEPKAR